MRNSHSLSLVLPALLLVLAAASADDSNPAAISAATAVPPTIQRMVRDHAAAVLGQGTVGDLAFYVMQAGEQRQVFLLSPAGFLITGQVYGEDGKLLLDTQRSQPVIPESDTQPAQPRHWKAARTAQGSSEQVSDADERALIQQALQDSAGPSGGEAVWQDLGQAVAIEEGLGDAPIVYVFFDPYCPYCHEQWTQLRGAVREQHYRIRWVPVAVLEPSRQNIGAVLGLLANPAPEALTQWMSEQRIERTDNARAKLALIRNNVLFKRLQSSRVPTLLYQDTNGEIVMHSGVLPL